MDHRSYLYASNLVPSLDNIGRSRRIAGLAECRYSIPALMRVLLSGSPRLCLSNIWRYRSALDGPAEPIAISARFADGLANLQRLRAKLSHPGALAQVDEALAFLGDPDNRDEYLLLELAEVLALLDEHEAPRGKLPAKAASVCAELQGDPEPALQALAEALNALPRSAEPELDRLQTGALLGHCVWSSVLYHTPSTSGA